MAQTKNTENKTASFSLSPEERSLLLGTPLFRGVAEKELDGLLTLLGASRKTFPKGGFLLHAGEETRRFGLLLEGHLLIQQDDFWGNENLMARLSPGDLFAESFALLPGARLTVDVRCGTEGVLLWLDASAFTGGVGVSLSTAVPTGTASRSTVAGASGFSSTAVTGTLSSPLARITENFLRILAAKNLHFNEKLIHMGHRSIRGKLLSFLSVTADRTGSADFTIPFSRQQLADYLGVDRSALSAVLSSLQKEGLLRYRRNHFSLSRKISSL